MSSHRLVMLFSNLLVLSACTSINQGSTQVVSIQNIEGYQNWRVLVLKYKGHYATHDLWGWIFPKKVNYTVSIAVNCKTFDSKNRFDKSQIVYYQTIDNTIINADVLSHRLKYPTTETESSNSYLEFIENKVIINFDKNDYPDKLNGSYTLSDSDKAKLKCTSQT